MQSMLARSIRFHYFLAPLLAAIALTVWFRTTAPSVPDSLRVRSVHPYEQSSPPPLAPAPPSPHVISSPRSAEAPKMGASKSKADSNWQSLHGKGPETNMAVFGAGCYWGTEAYFQKKYGAPGPDAPLQATAVGFMGPKGSKPNPGYEEVCSGQTGHVEVLAVTYNPDKVSYEDLVKTFFTFHDPTTLNRQGNDAGTQYASVIFSMDEQQEKTATQVRDRLSDLLSSGSIKYAGRGPYKGKKVETVIWPATKFYAAHEEHQMYLERNPNGYCNHGIRMKWEDQPSA